MPLSDAVDVSASEGGMACASPEKGVSPKEPPKMGEGGNWQCHSCLNINYPRRTICNRCLTERSRENSRKVLEFIRLKEGFLIMGLDQQTAAAAASAQQAARASTSNSSCTLPMNNRNRMINGRVTGSNSTMGDSTDRMNSNTSTGRSLLELEADGLRLLSCPLERQQQQEKLQQQMLRGSASFDPAESARTRERTSRGLLKNPHILVQPVQPQRQQHHKREDSEAAGGLGISSRDTSGGLLVPSSSSNNSTFGDASSYASDEEVSSRSLSRLRETVQLSGNSRNNVQYIMLRAGLLVGKLLREFRDKQPQQQLQQEQQQDQQQEQQQEQQQKQHQEQRQVQAAEAAGPSAAAKAKADDVLRAALAMLTATGTGKTQAADACDWAHQLSQQQEDMQQLRANRIPGFPQMLAHPDEFKNPSSFLKIYGDPLCLPSPCASAALTPGSNSSSNSATNGTSVSPPPYKDGNWLCFCCGNINFPRRFRCNKCYEPRGPDGDRVVYEYARAVYAKHAEKLKQLQRQRKLQSQNRIYSSQSQNGNDSQFQFRRRPGCDTDAAKEVSGGFTCSAFETRQSSFASRNTEAGSGSGAPVKQQQPEDQLAEQHQQEHSADATGAALGQSLSSPAK